MSQHTTQLARDDPLFAKNQVKNGTGLIITGKTTAPALKGVMSEETHHLTEDDLHDACEQAIGQPLMYNHDGSRGVLGRVVKAKPDAAGRIEVDVELEDTPEGWLAFNEASNKELIGFSWGRRDMRQNDAKLVKAVTDKQLVELSITANPEFKDALITSVSKRSELQERARDKLKSLLKSTAGHELFGQAECVGKFTCGTSTKF